MNFQSQWPYYVNCSPILYYHLLNSNGSFYYPQVPVSFKLNECYCHQDSKERNNNIISSFLSFQSSKNDIGFYQRVNKVKQQFKVEEPQMQIEQKKMIREQKTLKIQEVQDTVYIKQQQPQQYRYQALQKGYSVPQQVRNSIHSHKSFHEQERATQHKGKFNTIHKSNSNIQMLLEVTKQLIIYVLQNYSTPLEIYNQIKVNIVQESKRILKRDQSLLIKNLDEVIKILISKFQKFKKTKEEMVKHVFRKIFNPKNKPKQINDLKWKIAQKIHLYNCQNFRSMNLKYVEKQFQNPIFEELFQLYLQKFEEIFLQDNDQRIQKLNNIVVCALISQDFSELKSYKKVPWTHAGKKGLKKLIMELIQIRNGHVYPESTILRIRKQCIVACPGIIESLSNKDWEQLQKK